MEYELLNGDSEITEYYHHGILSPCWSISGDVDIIHIYIMGYYSGI